MRNDSARLGPRLHDTGHRRDEPSREGISIAFLGKVTGLAVMLGITTFRMAPTIESMWRVQTLPPADIEEIERSVYYPGCHAARAAGVAPIHRGSPGYRSEMDGDADGIACEPPRR